MGSVDQLQKLKVGQQQQFMNNQLNKKMNLNHDPSEISDSESVLSNDDKTLKAHKQHAQEIEKPDIKRVSLA